MGQLERSTQIDLLYWRSVWNKEGREVKATELPSNGNKLDTENEQSGTPNDRTVNGSKNRKRKKKSKPPNAAVCRTKTTKVGTKEDSDVKCTMTSDTEDNSKET